MCHDLQLLMRKLCGPSECLGMLSFIPDSDVFFHVDEISSRNWWFYSSKALICCSIAYLNIDPVAILQGFSLKKIKNYMAFSLLIDMMIVIALEVLALSNLFDICESLCKFSTLSCYMLTARCILQTYRGELIRAPCRTLLLQ